MRFQDQLAFETLQEPGGADVSNCPIHKGKSKHQFFAAARDIVSGHRLIEPLPELANSCRRHTEDLSPSETGAIFDRPANQASLFQPA